MSMTMTFAELVAFGDARGWSHIGKRGPQAAGFHGQAAVAWFRRTYADLSDCSPEQRAAVAVAEDPKLLLARFVAARKEERKQAIAESTKRAIEKYTSEPCWLGFGLYVEDQLRSALARGYKPVTAGELSMCEQRPHDHAVWQDGSSEWYVLS